MKPLPSLRLRLLFIIGAALLGVWSLVAAWMLVDLRSKMSHALDDRLAASARMVASIVTQLPGSLNARPEAMASALDVVARDGLACEISLIRGEIVSAPLVRTTHSPGLAEVPTGYGMSTFGGRQWRTFVLESGGLRVATADRIDVRDGLVRDVALTAGVPFVLALLFSLALLWGGIGRGLQPLERLRSVLAQRRPDDASALPPLDSPAELKPLVDTVDHLLKRMHAALERERRFTDDAAHELRSPLTGIKTHLQVLRLTSARPEHADTAAQALADAELGVQALHATLEQLLSLARLDAPSQDGCSEPADAVAAARQAVAEAMAATQGASPIAWECPFTAGELAVAVPAPLLRAALRNLLDNALQHGASAQPVRLRIERPDAGHVRFVVQDRGRGLSAEECAQAVQRFWRRGPVRSGSGLGLPIVQAIARRHGGTLVLQPGPGGGLLAALTVPVCVDAAPARP